MWDDEWVEGVLSEFVERDVEVAKGQRHVGKGQTGQVAAG